jgi:hypothetical protein
MDGRLAACNDEPESRDTIETNAGVYLANGVHSIRVTYSPCHKKSQREGTGLWLIWKKPGDKDFSTIPGGYLRPEKRIN